MQYNSKEKLLFLFEYCSPVWMSAAQCHLKLLDKALNSIKFLLSDFSITISHRRHIATISMFYTIFNNPDHPLHSKLPAPYIPVRATRHSVSHNARALQPVHCSTTQYFTVGVLFPSLQKCGIHCLMTL